MKKRVDTMKWNEYKDGVRTGVPVGLGYFSVSFGFGAMAIAQGLNAADATLISATNLTSAGQFAGLTLIVAMGTLWEMVMTQIVINSRYSLMSLALSQRMGERIGFWPRLIIAFFNTDEIFALAMARTEPLTVPFLLGLGTLPIVGWTGGTLMGALAGSVLPADIQAALGVMLYGMFIAIVVPPAKQERPVLITVALALVFSCLFAWLPVLKTVSAGISIVLCTVAAAAIGAALFPIREEEAAQ
jgi:predicted branched-subunit amino acid permease